MSLSLDKVVDIGLRALAIAALALFGLVCSGIAGGYLGAAGFGATSDQLNHEGAMRFGSMLFASFALSLGAFALALAGVRPMSIRIGAPVLAIAAFAVLAGIALDRMASDPEADERRNRPLLAEVKPLAGSESTPRETIAMTNEFLPGQYVTRRIDLLPATTTPRQAAAYYAAAMRRRGWRLHINGDVAENWPYTIGGSRNASRLSIWILRGQKGTRVELRAEHTSAICTRWTAAGRCL